MRLTDELRPFKGLKYLNLCDGILCSSSLSKSRSFHSTFSCAALNKFIKSLGGAWISICLSINEWTNKCLRRTPEVKFLLEQTPKLLSFFKFMEVSQHSNVGQKSHWVAWHFARISHSLKDIYGRYLLQHKFNIFNFVHFFLYVVIDSSFCRHITDQLLVSSLTALFKQIIVGCTNISFDHNTNKETPCSPVHNANWI